MVTCAVAGSNSKQQADSQQGPGPCCWCSAGGRAGRRQAGGRPQPTRSPCCTPESTRSAASRKKAAPEGTCHRSTLALWGVGVGRRGQAGRTWGRDARGLALCTRACYCPSAPPGSAMLCGGTKVQRCSCPPHRRTFRLPARSCFPGSPHTAAPRKHGPAAAAGGVGPGVGSTGR
jgi:hypothetical protein